MLIIFERRILGEGVDQSPTSTLIIDVEKEKALHILSTNFVAKKKIKEEEEDAFVLIRCCII